MQNIEIVKEDLITQINKRVEEKIIEPTNAKLLKKLISNAESTNEAMMIAELGTTYKRTGFHFDKRLEKMGTDIKYLKKNAELSFTNNPAATNHKLIIGDNYDALQQLLITHRGKIDVIYIDPPYGCNDMGEFANTNYTNSLSRDNLLSMMYPRFMLAKQLLSKNGVIFCSIDDKNHAHVKCLMDEIFAERNFIANIVWQSTGGSNTGEDIVTVTEYILMYAKTEEYKIKLLSKDTDKCKLEDEFIAERGRFYLQKLDGKFTKDHYSDSLYYPIEYNGKQIYPGASGGEGIWNWRWSKAKVQWGIENGFIHFQEDKDGTKVYFKNYEKVDNNNKPRKPSVPPKNVFIGTDKCTTGTGTTQLNSIVENNGFDFPKNTILIKYLLNLVDTSESCVVLDFFAGSGTTGHAVLELNREDGGHRQFILCTNNEITESNPNGIAHDVTSKRLKRVMCGKCYDGTDNFKWLEKNAPYGDNLDVYDIESVNSTEQTKDKSPFDVIDETCYDIPCFASVHEKISWICNNFENTQKYIREEE